MSDLPLFYLVPADVRAVEEPEPSPPEGPHPDSLRRLIDCAGKFTVRTATIFWPGSKPTPQAIGALADQGRLLLQRFGPEGLCASLAQSCSGHLGPVILYDAWSSFLDLPRIERILKTAGEEKPAAVCGCPSGSAAAVFFPRSLAEIAIRVLDERRAGRFFPCDESPVAVCQRHGSDLPLEIKHENPGPGSAFSLRTWEYGVTAAYLEPVLRSLSPGDDSSKLICAHDRFYQDRLAAVILGRLETDRTGRPSQALKTRLGLNRLAIMAVRMGKCCRLGPTVMACPANRENDALAEASTDLGWNVYRGEDEDPNARLLKAAEAAGRPHVAKFVTEQALLCPDATDELAAAHMTADSACTFGAGFPKGSVPEFYAVESLRRILRRRSSLRDNRRPLELFRSHPLEYRVLTVEAPVHQRSSRTLWVVDGSSLDDAVTVQQANAVDLDETLEVLARVQTEKEKPLRSTVTRKNRKADTPPRVILVNHSGGLGGAERSLALLNDSLVEHEFRTATLLAEDGPLAELFRQKGTSVHILPFPTIDDSMTGLTAGICSHEKLKEIFRQEEADFVHFNSVPSSSGLAESVKMIGLPYTVHVRDWISTRTEFQNARLADAEAVLCVSRAVRDELHGHCGKELASRVQVVHNGVDLERFHPSSTPGSFRSELKVGPETFLVGSVSEAVSWKGQDVLIRAVPYVLNRFPKAVFVIVGAATVNPLESRFRWELEKLVRELGIGSQVRFMGYREDIPRIMGDLDVFVHVPTRPDPFPRVVLEALACGRPIIASRIGGIPEALADDTSAPGSHPCGILVPPDDSLALASAMLFVAQRPDLRGRLAVSGRQRAEERFGHEKTGALAVKTFLSVLR